MADFTKSVWIWADDNVQTCDRVLFRRTFTLEKPPKRADVSFCARDTASVYINGKPIALGVTGVVTFDVAKYLAKGENVLGFDCLYYGHAANGYEPPATSGLIVASEALGIFSDTQFTAYRPYRIDDGEPHPSGRFFGCNVYTDGSRGELGGVFETAYGSTLFAPATAYEAGTESSESAPVNRVYDGEIKVRKMTKTVEGVTVTYVCDLGGEKTFYPVIELVAMGTERVEVKSDRYISHGAWGEDEVTYGTRGTYVCRNGVQEYACPIPLYGSALIIVAPATVNIRTVDLRVTSYPVRRVLQTDGDARTETLLDKCDNTMRACLDGGVLDNDDRDRGCDLLALSVFARAATLCYDDSVSGVLRHALLTVAEHGVLADYAGGPRERENAATALLFCSRFGAPAAYYYRTGDEETIKALYPLLFAFVSRWSVQEGRAFPPEDAQQRRADAGYNVDEELIETCLYYSAAQFLRETAEIAGAEYSEELSLAVAEIEENFARNYRKDDCFSSGAVCDERANALAVLCSLAGEDAAVTKDVLLSCHNASPAFEGFVIEALGAVAGANAARERLLRRFQSCIDGDGAVMPEYFFHDGSACSTLSVTPVAAYVCGVAGIKYTGVRKLTVALPSETKDMRLELPAGEGSIKLVVKNGNITVENTSGSEIDILHDGEIETLAKGKWKK